MTPYRKPSAGETGLSSDEIRIGMEIGEIDVARARILAFDIRRGIGTNNDTLYNPARQAMAIVRRYSARTPCA